MKMNNSGLEDNETDGFKSLENVKLIEKNGNSVTLEFSIQDTSPYFKGHFPDFQILPAVAQIEIVIRFSRRYFGTEIALSQLKRLKFSSLIRPSALLRLKIENDGDLISFNLGSSDGGISYSSGTVAAL